MYTDLNSHWQYVGTQLGWGYFAAQGNKPWYSRPVWIVCPFPSMLCGSLCVLRDIAWLSEWHSNNISGTGHGDQRVESSPRPAVGTGGGDCGAEGWAQQHTGKSALAVSWTCPAGCLCPATVWWAALFSSVTKLSTSCQCVSWTCHAGCLCPATVSWAALLSSVTMLSAEPEWPHKLVSPLTPAVVCILWM